MLTGIAQPFDVIEIYISDEATCQSDDCQGMTYLGNSGADNTGNWQFQGFFAFGQQVVALSRNSGRQSSFSQCFKVCPGAIQPVVGNNGPYCENDTIQLFSDIDVSEFQWVSQIEEIDVVYDWTGPNGFTSNEKHPKNIAERGDYILQAYLLGCPSQADTTEVEVTTLQAVIEEVPISCRAESIPLQSNITASLGIGRITYQWSGPDGYTSNERNPVDALTSGTYNLLVSGKGCQAQAESIVVTNHFPDPFSLGENTAICLGETIALAVPNQEFLQWESSLDLVCDTCAAIELTPTENGEIHLTAGPTPTCTTEAKLVIAVMEPVHISEELILCPGSSLNLFTKIIDQPGTYQATFTTQSGCDSNHTFIVTQPEINQVVEAQTICEGDIVNQFGQTYTTSGIYEASFTAANGCDSTHILELAVLPPMFVEETYTICAGESMAIFEVPTSETTTIARVFTAANGCDSTHQINLIVEETYQESAKMILCQGETVNIDGVEIGQSGFFQSDYTANNGCDSVIMLEIEVLAPIETFQLITLCEEEALALFGEESAFPSDYVETLTAQSGCDSMNYVSYDIKRRQETEEFFTICGTDQLILEGNEITTSGRYSYTYTASNGCDSTHITDVTVLEIPQREATYELCSGESVDLFGTMVNSAGSYSSMVSNINGCDSFLTVTVFIKETEATNETMTICEGETVMVFDKLVASEEVLSQTFVGNNGCDSIHTIEVSILPKIQTEATTAICEAECIELYGARACLDKIYQQTFSAFSGCDSTHTLFLEIEAPQEVVQEYSLCEGDSLVGFDTFIKEAGVFSRTFTNVNGCDSMHTLVVTELSENQVFESRTICQGEVYTQFGNSYFATGTYEASFTAVNGCDSTHVLDLTVLTPTFAEEVYELCEGTTALILGETVSEANTISKVFTAANGCDSTHTVTVFIKEALETEEVLTICEGETITLFDQLVSSEEVVSQTFSSASGCDSTHTIMVNVLNKVTTESTTTVCESACVEIYGATACADKVYRQTFTASSGCDSIHNLFLIPTNQEETTASYTLCPGDSLAVFGSFIKEAGIFSEMFTGTSGCDSLHTIVLEFTDELATDISTTPSCLESNEGRVELNIIGGMGPYTTFWEGNNRGNALAFDNLEPGIYDLTVNDVLGCQTNQQIEITAIPTPEISSEILSISCFGANDGAVELFANQPNLTYSLDGINYSREASFLNLSPATYQVFIKDETGCNYMEEFTLYEPVPLAVTLPIERTISLGATIQLVPVTTTENVNYDWAASSSLSCLDCENPVASPLEDTQYTLTIYDENNCEGQAQILVRVDDNKKVFVPNVFSPDDDGLNDNFSILTIEGPVQEVTTFKIYDRWGNLIYEANNFDPLDEKFGWNGHYKGKPMDNGVFIYYAIIKYIDGTEEELTGDITLTK